MIQLTSRPDELTDDDGRGRRAHLVLEHQPVPRHDDVVADGAPRAPAVLGAVVLEQPGLPRRPTAPSAVTAGSLGVQRVLLLHQQRVALASGRGNLQGRNGKQLQDNKRSVSVSNVFTFPT